MSEQRTLPGMTSAISSPGSGAGPSPCGGPDSKALPESGPAPVRVSRFRALASDRATPTSATFGPLFTASSPSADLQRCLASRLRALMDVNGSPEFALTWKDWDIPAGEPICALRASERRTGGKGCSGWPTCSARDWKDTPGMSETGVNPDGTERKRLDMLPRVAQLAAWPTPRTPTGGPETAERKQELGRTESGGGDLAGVAQLAAWATPRAEDAESAGMRHSRGVADTLTAQAGQSATSCPAGTGKRGVLRPGHSRWLMGYPAAWDSCGATAMQSCRKSRRSS